MTDVRFGPKFQFFAEILVCSNIIPYSAFSSVYCFFESAVGHIEGEKPVGCLFCFIELSFCQYYTWAFFVFLFFLGLVVTTQACLELVNNQE